MVGIVKTAKLRTRSDRAALKLGRKPHWIALMPGRLHLGYRRKKKTVAGTWLVRRYKGQERYQVAALGLADDFDDVGEENTEKVLDFAAACRAAQQWWNSSPEMRRAANLTAIENLRLGIAGKFLDFLKRDIEPECYLYRHYHPNGDLLYVGISLELFRRQRRHYAEAHWADAIHQIIIEPFETREQALAAEEQAIRTEFPKHNVAHNRRRSPLRELARVNTETTTREE
jgi:hypothetical protein